MIIFGKLFINYLKTNKYKVIEQTYHLKNVILTFKMYNNKYPYHRFWIFFKSSNEISKKIRPLTKLKKNRLRAFS